MIIKLIISVQHGFGVGFWEVVKIPILNFSKNFVKSDIFVLLRLKFLKILILTKLLDSTVEHRLHQPLKISAGTDTN